MKCCPIEIALRHIGNKWCINILRDLFSGKKRFNEFLKSNKNLSSKVLTERLIYLQEEKLITKKGKHYMLTPKGKKLNKILYELAMFSFKEYATEVFYENDKAKKKEIAQLKRLFL